MALPLLRGLKDVCRSLPLIGLNYLLDKVSLYVFARGVIEKEFMALGNTEQEIEVLSKLGWGFIVLCPRYFS